MMNSEKNKNKISQPIVSSITLLRNTILKDIYLELAKFFRKTSVKIAMVISFTMLTLLALLNVAVIERSRNSFVDIINTIAVGPITKKEGDSGEVTQYNILRFYQDGTERPKPLQEEFVEDFQASLLSIGIITIVLSFCIGLLASQFFTRPLRVLSNGMRKLKHNDYKLKLTNTGAEEFDEVICEFNHLTDELAKVEKLRKDLISDTSHELKTPITSLIGQLQGVKDGLLKMDKDRADLLLSQVERLSDIVERLQEFSRLQSKTIKIKFENINLKNEIERLVKQFANELESSKINVNLEIDEKYTLKSDKEMIIQIFSNLLSNSIKYSNASKITIKATKKTIIFEDDGIGISDEHKKYIFERFYRVEKSRNRKTGGLGLGLAIVKELVEALNWKISVKNSSSGGAMFVITL